jgi:chemotaxis protein methyltransferase CheR
MPHKLSDIEITNVSDFINHHMALNFVGERHPDMLRRVEAAGRELGFSTVREFLLTLTSAPRKAQIDCLARHLTVTETYFWREPEMFAALQEAIIPELLHAKADKTLRIWSAGCSSGEEPYSIAMALGRSIPDISQWNIAIDATDINRHALAKAKAGVYGDWSFRKAPDWLHAYFSKTGDGQYAVASTLRNMVHFAFGNLADCSMPMSSTGEPYDIIFCRNVLMYFSQEKTRSLAQRFHDAMSTPGFFIVSASELSYATFSPFQPVTGACAHYYRKGEARPERVQLNDGVMV